MKNETAAEPKERAGKKGGSPGGFVRVLCVLFILLLIVCAAVLIYASYTKTHYKIVTYEETSPKVSGSLRIAVTSDIHNREYGEGNEKLISDLRALKPDLILFPGDMVVREEDVTESSATTKARGSITKTTGICKGSSKKPDCGSCATRRKRSGWAKIPSS